MIRVEQKKNFEVGSVDFEAFVGLAVGTGGSGGLNGDRTRRQFLGNDHAKSLHAAHGPVVDDGRAIGLQRQRAGDFAGGTVGRLDFRSAFGEPAAAGWSDFKFLVADGLSAEFDGELALVLSEDNGAGRLRSFLLSRERQRDTRHDSECQSKRCGSEFHGVSYPRVHSLSRKRFLNNQMRGVSTGCNNAAAQDFRDNLGGLAGAVDSMVGELIGGEALGVERAEAGFVAEKRTAGHGHASRKQNWDGGIQPQNRNAGSAQKVGAARLCVSAAAKGENSAFFQLRGAAEGGAKLIRFDLAEGGFAEAFEDLRNRQAGKRFDAVIEVDKAPGELASEERANGGLAGTHETGKAENRDAKLLPAQRRCSGHAIAARKTSRASECELYHCRRRVRLWRGPVRRCRRGPW